MNEVPTAKTETEKPVLAYKGQRRKDGTSRFQEFGLLIVIAILFVILSVAGKYFATGRYWNNFLNLDNIVNGIGQDNAVYAVMAVGMTFVIISGGIDISVGSIMGLSAVMTAMSLQSLTKLDDNNNIVSQASPVIVWLVATCVPLAVGLLCGFFNGMLIVGLRLHPFIVTLGTMAIFRWAKYLPEDKTFPTPGHTLPPSFKSFMQFDVSFGKYGVPLTGMPAIISIVVVAAGWLYLSRMIWGRETYAIGGNEEAARYSGLNVGAIKLRTYLLMGLTCGIAAMISVGRFQSATTITGAGDELSVIAAAAVGGASMLGGRGTALGAFLGALVLTLIKSGIATFHFNEKHRDLVVGSAIIIAVVIDRISEDLRQRRLMAGRQNG